MIMDTMDPKTSGLVLEVIHPETPKPDYRTPTNILVLFADSTHTTTSWFAKNELELIK